MSWWRERPRSHVCESYVSAELIRLTTLAISRRDEELDLLRTVVYQQQQLLVDIGEIRGIMTEQEQIVNSLSDKIGLLDKKQDELIGIVARMREAWELNKVLTARVADLDKKQISPELLQKLRDTEAVIDAQLKEATESVALGVGEDAPASGAPSPSPDSEASTSPAASDNFPIDPSVFPTGAPSAPPPTTLPTSSESSPAEGATSRLPGGTNG